jgi:hypothetical protein
VADDETDLHDAADLLIALSHFLRDPVVKDSPEIVGLLSRHFSDAITTGSVRFEQSELFNAIADLLSELADRIDDIPAR